MHVDATTMLQSQFDNLVDSLHENGQISLICALTEMLEHLVEDTEQSQVGYHQQLCATLLRVHGNALYQCDEIIRGLMEVEQCGRLHAVALLIDDLKADLANRWSTREDLDD